MFIPVKRNGHHKFYLYSPSNDMHPLPFRHKALYLAQELENCALLFYQHRTPPRINILQQEINAKECWHMLHYNETKISYFFNLNVFKNKIAPTWIWILRKPKLASFLQTLWSHMEQHVCLIQRLNYSVILHR